MRQSEVITVAGGSKEFNPADSKSGLDGATQSGVSGNPFVIPLDPNDNIGGPCGTRYNCCPNDKNIACVDSLCSNCPTNNLYGLYGATARITDAANKSLPKDNARIVKQVLGGLAGLTSAACVVSAYIAAEKARKEKNVLNKVLTGAAAAGTAAAALEILLQSYDLFMEKEQPKLGDQNDQGIEVEIE